MDRWRSARRAVRGIVILAAPLGIVILTAPGCGSLTPRNFRAMLHPAPVVRAGAVSLGDDQPDAVAIPAWIARLDDKDPVVRMAANESLKKRTRQDFGFVAWAEPPERAAAVAKWKAWWKAKPMASPQGGLVTKRRNG
jgi:hypothetical protein